MATYQKTIIIESNKQSALAAERGDGIKLTGMFDETDEINTGNHRWETHIPDGLPLQIGDTINLESSMINAVGGGDAVIELTGFTGEQASPNDKIRDNKSSLKLAYYITNAHQFNFNLPKARHQTCYNVKKSRYGSYANTYGDNFSLTAPVVAPNTVLNNADFYSWEKSYPYQNVEGVGTHLDINTGASLPYEYKTVQLAFTDPLFYQYLPSYASGSRRTCLPNERRFYIGNREYTGHAYVNEVNIQVPDAPAGTVYSYATGMTHWDYLTNEIEFEIEKGFLTPSSLAAKMTEQLHEREGLADNFTEENVDAVLFSWGNRVDGTTGNDEGILAVDIAVGVTDQANILIPTAPGKMLYRQFNFRNGKTGNPKSTNPLVIATDNNNWQARDITYEQMVGAGNPRNSKNIFDKINFSARGQKYLKNQGDACYYSYIASARPEYMKAQSILNTRMAYRPKSQGGNPGDIFTLWTGHRTFGGAGGAPPVADCITTQQHFPPFVTGDPEPPSTPIYTAGATGPNIVLMDGLPFQNAQVGVCVNKPQPGETFPFTYTQSLTTIKTWNPQPLDPVVTNIIVNDTTKAILEDAFRDYFVVYGKTADTVNPEDLGFRNAMALELNFGRLDDQQSSFDNVNAYPEYYDTNTVLATCEVNVPSPYATIFYQSIQADATNPYNLTGFQYEHKVDKQLQATTGLPAPNTPGTPSYTNADYNYPTAQRPALPGTIAALEGRWYAEYYLPDEYTAEALYSGLVSFRAGTGTRFQTEPNDSLIVQYPFERYKTEIYDKIPTDANGKKLAMVPVCWRLQGTGQGATVWMGAGSYQEWYFAWLYKARIPPDFQPIVQPVEVKTDAQYNTAFPQPLPYVGEYVGLSPSEFTCDLAQIVTTQKRPQSNVYVPALESSGTDAGKFTAKIMPCVSPSFYVPFINVGATDPLIKFDDTQGRFALSQFHTPLKEGNGTFQIPKIPSSTEPNNIQMAANFKRAMISSYKPGLFQQPPAVAALTSFNKIVSEANTLINALSGIGVVGVGYYTENITASQELDITSGGRDIYRNTLFSKMGFSLEQLLPFFGTSQAQFNRANYNEYLGFRNGINPYLKYNNMVKPFTTNAFISATIMMGLARIMAFSDIPAGSSAPAGFEPTDAMFSPVPAENLGSVQPDQPGDIQAESDELIALNLPKKLSYPYLVVRTNLILNPEYIGGKTGFEKLPAIAFITRNYSEGDYFYSFTTNWNYTVDLPYVVSSIITDIRLPDGRPAPIDDNSSVIYKINKLRTLPNIEKISQDEVEEMKAESKEKPKVAPQS